MKAIVYYRYGSPDVLKCEEIEKPTPADDEVLIRVRAASVNPVDRRFRGKPYTVRIMTGLRKPKDTRLGVDVAGEVEAVGRNITQFKPGDEVFGACRGALAEYACAHESKLALKPANVTFEQAAAVPIAGLTALQGLRDKGQIRAGQKVLINGAAGGVGTFAVQLAKSFGAGDVTGVCSTRNVEMVRSIGADQVIDYTQEDFTKGTERYDLILDCVVNHSLSACRRVLYPQGRYVIVGAPQTRWMIGILSPSIKALVLSPFVRQKFRMLIARLNKEDLTIMRDLMEAGKVMPVIDRHYRLSEVPEAIRYLEERHARGKVVITL
jgi:NADPH:quinone reductase-like Zn-dependent oxidoreductase